MKIKRQLPQFKDKKTLIIVAGQQSAVLYNAHNGEIKEIDRIHIETPVYSDREGFFATRTRRQGTARSGAVYENKKDETQRRFAKELNSKVQNLEKTNRFDQFYMCAPRPTASLILDKISNPLKDKIVKKVYGNLIEFHPFNILERLN
jgi:protein required for attachment to host cells